MRNSEYPKARHGCASPAIVEFEASPVGAADVVSSLQSEAFFSDVAAAASAIGPELKHVLSAMAGNSSECSVLLVRDVPIGEVPATPPVPVGVVTPGRVAELWLLAVASLLGEPVGYRQEHDGDVVQNLLPVRVASRMQTSTSSAVTLSWHTETAFHPYRPRFLVLLALRGDPEAFTLFADVRDVVARLDDETIRCLREPLFTTGVDASFGRSSLRVGPFPVLSFDDAGLSMWFDADLMRGETAAADEALKRFLLAVEDSAQRVALNAGDCLVVDNRRVAHGRSIFHPRFDGSDRWLQRALVVEDLDASAAERVGRVITTSF